MRTISELTGYNRNTVSKYLAEPSKVPVYGPRAVQESKLDPLKEYLKGRLQAGVWNAQVLLRELQQREYDGGYTDSERLAATATGVGASGGRTAF